MARIGYECRKCGYEPTEQEAQNGICPQCHPPPAPSIRTALVRALRALSEATGKLSEPETKPGSTDDVVLQTFIDRVNVIKKDIAAEIKKRVPKS